MNGEQLKARIEFLGIKNTDLLKHPDIKTRQIIQTWFTYQNVGTGILEKICDACGLKINDFYKGTKYAVEEINPSDAVADGTDLTILKLVNIIEKMRTAAKEDKEAYEAILKEKEKEIKKKDGLIESLYRDNMELNKRLINDEAFQKTEEKVAVQQ